ncbi:hypothetical protein BGY98DRAFT_1012665, partial [Russula aff. rugulosa BPL654]
AFWAMLSAMTMGYAVSSHAANRKLTVLEIWVNNSDGSIGMSSKSETDPSRMAITVTVLPSWMTELAIKGADHGKKGRR